MPEKKQPEPVLENLGDTMSKYFVEDSSSLDKMASSDLVKLIQELRDRQIQLEMQNEELRKNQLELVTSREAFRSLWELAPVGYLILDMDGRIIVVNKAGMKLFDRRKEKILKNPLTVLVHPQDQVTVNFLLIRALNTKKVERGEIRLSASDKPIRYCQMECSVLDNELEPERIQVVLTDITRQKAIEEQCRGHMERLQLALEGGQLGMWDRDLYTGETVWSPVLYDLLGRDPNGPGITSDTFFQYIHEKDRPRVREKVNKWFQSNEMDFREEFRVLRDDGQIRWLASVGRAFKDEAGNIFRITGINYDITERKLTEQELKQLNSELEQRVVERTRQAEKRSRKLQQLTLELAEAEDRERQRISSILHDHLQQNLVSMKLRVETLLPPEKIDPELNEKIETLMSIIHESISETRDLSRQLSPPALRMQGLMAGLQWLATEMKVKQGLEVSIDPDPEAEPVSASLASVLFRSVREILFNVVKHSGVKNATVKTGLEGDRIFIEVNDRGKGFDYGGLRKKGLTSGGVGLLSIRETLSYLGGELKIDSVPGNGCKVRLFVPKNAGHDKANASSLDSLVASEKISQPTNREPRVQNVVDGRKIRIILADDHDMMREGLANLLETQEDFLVVGQAADGRQAVQMASDLAPDVVLLDIAMPVMNGFRAAEEIKKIRPQARIIGISMFEDSPTREKMLQAGASKYLSKGVSSTELIDTVRGVFEE